MTGWYRLPHSGAPYFGPVPDGAEELSEGEAVASHRAGVVAAADSVAFGEVSADALAELTVDTIRDRAAEVDRLEVIERLIRDEYSGRHRQGALAALERRKAELEGATDG